MKLFSVVLTNYNQEEYIYQAIDSVLMQDYGRIQLIITDDHSEKFDKKEISEYIATRKSLNIEKVDFVVNDSNIGTVQTLNKALDFVRGDYVMFFAADDALFEPGVISRFVNEFYVNPDSKVLTSQSYMCDDNLQLNLLTDMFVSSEVANKFNGFTSENQFYYLSDNCIFVSGATAYDIDVFNKIGKFDEDFKLVEDWTYWLKLTENKIKIRYFDKVSLLHRNGGVSHINAESISEKVKDYYKDIIKVYTKYIIPRLNEMPKKYKMSIIDKYMFYLGYYEQYIPNLSKDNEESTKLAWKYTKYEAYFNKMQKKRLKEEQHD